MIDAEKIRTYHRDVAELRHMTVERHIIGLNRQHPDWNDKQLAEGAGCTQNYARMVCGKHKLARPQMPHKVPAKRKVLVSLDDDLRKWIGEEATRMGSDVRAHDVILAILRDARAGD